MTLFRSIPALALALVATLTQPAAAQNFNADMLPPQAAPAGDWTQCAVEGTTCSFSGTREVRFGASPTAPGQYIAKVYSTHVPCSNPAFGDAQPRQARKCWFSAATSPAAAATAFAPSPPPPPMSGSVPTPETIKGLPVVGMLKPQNGQVIEKVHVVNPGGPCIVVDGKRDVVIRDSEIGPCGHETNDLHHSGIVIGNGSTNILIERNVLHDAPALISVSGALQPIYIRRNLFYNVRGTSWAFQDIAFGGVRAATASTQILCNVMDDTLVLKYPMAGGRDRKVADHINIYDSGGTPDFPMEIAYNRIRGLTDGKGDKSGSGMQLGDSAAGGGGVGSNVPGYFNVHDNIIYHVNGAGIAIAGGVGSVVKDNKVDNRGESIDSQTGWPFALRNFDREKPASVTYSGNKGVANLWAYDRDGHRAPTFDKTWDKSGFKATDAGGNDWQHEFKTSIWDEPLNPACK